MATGGQKCPQKKPYHKQPSKLERNHIRLGVVKGYQLELVQTPFQYTPGHTPDKEQQAISVEIQSLLTKGAVVEANPHIDQFTSKLFVIPRKMGHYGL